jgi:hypothetical protein
VNVKEDLCPRQCYKNYTRNKNNDDFTCATVDSAEHIFLGYLAVLEDKFTRVRPAHSELVELLVRREAFETFLDAFAPVKTQTTRRAER